MVFASNTSSTVNRLLIFFRTQKIAGLSLINHFQKPCTFRILVHQRRVFFDLAVNLQHLTCHWSIHVCCYFHTLDDHSTVSLVESLAYCWKLNVNDQSELLLSMIRDADLGDLCAGIVLDPFVAFGVLFG